MSDEKKWVQREFESILMQSLSLMQLEELLTRTKAAESSGGWRNIHLTVASGYNSGECDMYLEGERLETDAEFQLRTHDAQLRKDWVEKEEIALLKRLKEKYEK